MMHLYQNATHQRSGKGDWFSAAVIDGKSYYGKVFVDWRPWVFRIQEPSMELF
jgi:hypothetical protein